MCDNVCVWSNEIAASCKNFGYAIWMFAKLTSSKVYACTGSISYSKIFGKYYARKAWDWGIIKTFYYGKRYVFWGDNIAKSVAGQW